MSTSTMLNLTSGDRLTLLLESIAQPKSSIPAQAADGITYWQTVRLMNLKDTWYATEAAQEFLTLRDQFSTTVGLTAAETDAIGEANWSVWNQNALYSYRTGFDFGAMRTTVPLCAQEAITQAIAALPDESWCDMLGALAVGDPWGEAAARVATLKIESLLPAGGMYGSAEWDSYVETLSQRFPNHGEAIRHLDEALTYSVILLREFMFHEGRLDGEVVSGGVAR